MQNRKHAESDNRWLYRWGLFALWLGAIVGAATVAMGRLPVAGVILCTIGWIYVRVAESKQVADGSSIGAFRRRSVPEPSPTLP